MEFTNFSLSRSAAPVELESPDGVWDLHNTSRFAGCSFEAEATTVVCAWVGAPSVGRDQPPTPYGGCELRFTGVRSAHFSLSLGGEVPDPSCVHYIAYEPAVDGVGTLRFEFLDGSRLTVTAHAVALVPIRALAG